MDCLKRYFRSKAVSPLCSATVVQNNGRICPENLFSNPPPAFVRMKRVETFHPACADESGVVLLLPPQYIHLTTRGV